MEHKSQRSKWKWNRGREFWWKVKILRNTAGDWKKRSKWNWNRENLDERWKFKETQSEIGRKRSNIKPVERGKDPWNNLTTFPSGFNYTPKFWSPFHFSKSSKRRLLKHWLWMWRRIALNHFFTLQKPHFWTKRSNIKLLQFTFNISGGSTWWGKAIWISDPPERLSLAFSSSGPWNMKSSF